MEEINCSGGHSAACHAQIQVMGAVLRHGSTEQKAYLPGIADGSIRLPSHPDWFQQLGLGATASS